MWILWFLIVSSKQISQQGNNDSLLCYRTPGTRYVTKSRILSLKKNMHQLFRFLVIYGDLSSCFCTELLNMNVDIEGKKNQFQLGLEFLLLQLFQIHVIAIVFCYKGFYRSCFSNDQSSI